MAKRRNKPAPSRLSPNLTRAELKELDNIADSVLKEVLDDLYDPNWRDQPSPPPRTLQEELELVELNRQLDIPFLATPYRLVKSKRPTRHQLGGQMKSEIPKCSICNNALVLFANLDATDSRLKGEHSLNRLPLLCCCSCPGPVHYHVNRSAKIRVLPAKVEAYDECPFTSWPHALSKGYLSLVRISDQADRALIKASFTEGFEALDAGELAAISHVLGRKPAGRWDCYFSQIGGYPNSYQGGEGKPDICPNVRCPIRRRRRAEFRYRPLAVLDLWHDRFWGHRSDALQIVYHICPGCFSISAKYTCT